MLRESVFLETRKVYMGLVLNARAKHEKGDCDDSLYGRFRKFEKTRHGSRNVQRSCNSQSRFQKWIAYLTDSFYPNRDPHDSIICNSQSIETNPHLRLRRSGKRNALVEPSSSLKGQENPTQGCLVGGNCRGTGLLRK